MPENKNTMSDLYSILFNTLKRLTDEKNPMDIDRARAIQQTSQTIVNAGELECRFLTLLGGTGTGFVTDADEEKSIGIESNRMKIVK